MLDGLILRHLVACATASRTPLLPGSFLRCASRRGRAARPGGSSTARCAPPDQFARRRRDARLGYSHADSTKRRSSEIGQGRVVRRKTLGDGYGVRGMERLCATGDFAVGRWSCALTCRPSISVSDRAVVTTCVDSGYQRRL